MSFTSFNSRQQLIFKEEPLFELMTRKPTCTQLDDFYYNLGHIVPAQSKPYFCINNLFDVPQMSSLKKLWAMVGLKSLLFSAHKPDTQVPVIFDMTAATAVKKQFKILMPYIDLFPRQEIQAIFTELAQSCNTQIPDYIVKALQAAPAATDKVTQNTRIHTLVVTALLNDSVMYYSKPVYEKNVTDADIASGKATPQYYETSYLTRSSYYLQTMAGQGCFSNATEPNLARQESIKKVSDYLEKLYGKGDTLFGTITATALENNTINTAKFSASSIQDIRRSKIIKYALSTFKTAPQLGANNIRLIPLRYLTIYYSGVLDVMETIPYFKTTAISEQNGEYSEIGTVLPQAYIKAYSDCKEKEIVEQKAYKPTGFSMSRNAFVFLNLESSIYSDHGYGKITPFELQSLQPIAENLLNKAAHNLQPAAIKTYFLQVLATYNKNGKLNASACQSIISGFPELQRVYKYDTYNFENIVAALDNVHYAAVLQYMRSHYKIFTANNGTEATLMQAISGLGLDLVYDSGHMLMAATPEAQIEELKAVIDKNFVRITYTSSNGETEIVTTNDESKLVQALGIDYIRKYEGWAKRANHIKQNIMNKAYGTVDEINQALALYNLNKELDANELIKPGVATTAADVDAWIAAGDAKRTRRGAPTPENALRVRNCRATNPSNYWAIININCVNKYYIGTAK